MIPYPYKVHHFEHNVWGVIFLDEDLTWHLVDKIVFINYEQAKHFRDELIIDKFSESKPN